MNHKLLKKCKKNRLKIDEFRTHQKNMLQKENAFGYLYKEHQKEIKLLIEKRDKEMEATLNYKEKLWT